MTWKDWTPAMADKIKVGDRVVILDGHAPRPGEAYGTVVRLRDAVWQFLVETPNGWPGSYRRDLNLPEGTYRFVPETQIRRLKTKDDLLRVMKKHGACGPATKFVLEHPSADAETIGRDALVTEPGWVDWLCYQVLTGTSSILFFKRLREAHPKDVVWQCYREWCRS